MKRMKKGILTVISGFSGAGKGTVVKSLLQQQDYSLSISATTRKPREGEEHGREYFFLTREEFESMIEEKGLIEWAQFVGNYYGTPKAYVESCLAEGKDVILEIELQGAMQVREQFPDAVMIFLTPPSAKELERRLVGRGTETMDVIGQRLARAGEECRYMDQYDYLVVNDDLQACVDQVHAIIQCAKCQSGRNAVLISQIQQQLQQYQ